MASQTMESLQQDGESNTFDFETWINQNGFQDVKDVFIELNISSLNTLSTTNNHFVQSTFNTKYCCCYSIIGSIERSSKDKIYIAINKVNIYE